MLSPEAIEARRLGVGGSEIAALFGLHPYIGELDVYLSKTDDYRSEPNEDMKRGSFLEDGIAQWYGDRENVPVWGPSPWEHPTEPVARCTPDRLVGAKEPGCPARLLSIKSPRRAGDEWGETGGHVVPTYAVLQVQWEMMIGKASGVPLDPVAHIAALIDGDLRIYPVESDAQLQGWLLERAKAWWAEHVVPRVPPALDGSETAAAWLKRRFPSNTRPLRQATLDEDVKLLELRQVEAEWERVDARYETSKQQVQELIGLADGLKGSVGQVSWRANKNGVRSFKTKWTKEQ